MESEGILIWRVPTRKKLPPKRAIFIFRSYQIRVPSTQPESGFRPLPFFSFPNGIIRNYCFAVFPSVVGSRQRRGVRRRLKWHFLNRVMAGPGSLRARTGVWCYGPRTARPSNPLKPSNDCAAPTGIRFTSTFGAAVTGGSNPGPGSFYGWRAWEAGERGVGGGRGRIGRIGRIGRR